MSDFDRYGPYASGNSSVWSLAALSIAACLCSVLGAKLLSQSFEQDDLNVLATSDGFQQIAGLGPSARGVRTPVAEKRMGVDLTATGSIPNKSSPKRLSPCGNAVAK